MWRLFCALWPGAVLVRSQLDDDLDNDLDDRFLSLVAALLAAAHSWGNPSPTAARRVKAAVTIWF